MEVKISTINSRSAAYLERQLNSNPTGLDLRLIIMGSSGHPELFKMAIKKYITEGWTKIIEDVLALLAMVDKDWIRNEMLEEPEWAEVAQKLDDMLAEEGFAAE